MATRVGTSVERSILALAIWPLFDFVRRYSCVVYPSTEQHTRSLCAGKVPGKSSPRPATIDKATARLRELCQLLQFGLEVCEDFVLVQVGFGIRAGVASQTLAHSGVICQRHDALGQLLGVARFRTDPAAVLV